MAETIYEHDGFILMKDGEKYFVQYDVGSHQIVLRRDEISYSDAARIRHRPTEASIVLLELQKRLLVAGIDPYTSNV